MRILSLKGISKEVPLMPLLILHFNSVALESIISGDAYDELDVLHVLDELEFKRSPHEEVLNRSLFNLNLSNLSNKKDI